MTKGQDKTDGGNEDYYIIFRWTYKTKSGKIVRAVNRPFPIRVKK